jgi:hypothetical protein
MCGRNYKPALHFEEAAMILDVWSAIPEVRGYDSDAMAIRASG